MLDSFCRNYRKLVKQTFFLLMRCIKCILSAISTKMFLMDRDTILKKIKMKRLSLELSQDDVAQALGLDESQYSRLENGKSQLDLVRLIPLIAFLGMKWSDFDDDSLPPGQPKTDSEDGVQKEVASIKEMLKTLSKEVDNLKKKGVSSYAS